MDKIVVSPQELESVLRTPDPSGRIEPKLPPAISLWVKVAFCPLVLVLPLLCLVTIILRVSTRNQPARVNHAWTAFLSTLLTISGFLTSAAAVLAVSLVPLPSVVSSGLSDLDERTVFPHLPASTPMSGVTVAAELKPLVAVITPARRLWFNHQEAASGILGAGILLRANSTGYLFATARHVVDGLGWSREGDSRALVAMASGAWAGADVIARHTNLDLALLWVPRESGRSDFVQPIASITDGENIFVIGHPEGLKFTISSGMISRVDQTPLFQISAPVSPGNSGGPVFDGTGNLVGIVVSKMDRSIDPNAENLSFAVRAETLLADSGWDFAGNGRQVMAEFTSTSRRGLSAGPSEKASIGALDNKTNANH
jgi:S1-C subfamily serine protease